MFFQSTEAKIIGLILLIAVLILIIGAGPLITIWSLNALFGLSILYNFKTWFAAFWLTSIVVARKINFKNKEQV